MKARWKILTAIAAAFGLVVLIPVIHHYQLRHAVESYLAELKAQGEPMDLAQVIPPPTPPEQNGVPLIMNALTNLEDNYKSISETNPPWAMREILPGKAMVGWQQPNIVGPGEIGLSGLLTNTWEDLDRELIAEKNDLDSFQSLTNHPVLDFNLDYEKGFPILRHLARLKCAEQWLNAAALYDLHERRTAEACAEVQTILAIVKGQAKEPLSISQQVREAIASMAVQMTWEILQAPDVPESDLASLQHDWESVEFIDAAKKSFQAERVVNLRSMKFQLQNPAVFWRWVSGNDEEISYKLCKLQWQWFWAYADERRMMQTYQVLADATQIAETNHSFQIVQAFTRTNFDRLGFEGMSSQEETFRMDIDQFEVRWLLSEDAFDSFSFLRRSMVLETARSMTVTAIALERYEFQNHQYPHALKELVPVFLTSVPIDYMNGQPLRYRRTADGTFLLYSVGENGKDDGGDPSLETNSPGSNYSWQNFQALDWVWPQPATAAEVESYYAHPPK